MRYETVSLTAKKAEDGGTCLVDHFVKEFKVRVRTMSNISADTMKNLIQMSYEVVQCEEVSQTTYVIPLRGD